VNKQIIAYLVGLVVIVIVALVLSGALGKGGVKIPGISTTTSIATSAPNSTVPTISTVQSSTTLPTTTIFFSQCQSSSPTVPITNGDFASGTYYGWSTTGPGFGSAPFNLTQANIVGAYYGAPWSGYSGEYVATTYQGGLSLQEGNLTSAPFEVTEPFLNFRIESPESNLIYVEILEGKNVSKFWYDTYNASNNTDAATKFVNASISLLETSFYCKNVSIRIVSGSVGPGNRLDYIAAGDFYLSNKPISTPRILVNQSLGRIG
jgi:hypothetical protein